MSTVSTPINKTTKTDIFNIDPRAIVVISGFNSREDFGDIDELAAQIKEQGVLNPISVIPFTDENGEQKYRLVDGERRYRAVMKLINDGVDIARIKALSLPKSMSDADLYIQQVMRNEGKPFNEYEMGVHCNKIKNVCGKTNTEIAKMLGKNVGQISYYLDILEMPVEVQEAIKTNRISGSNVRRIKSAVGGDEKKLVANVLKVIKDADAKGKQKASLKDLGEESEVTILKDSKAACKGLEIIFAYYYKATNGRTENFPLKMNDVYQRLKKGESLPDILNDLKTTYKQAQ